MFIGRVETTSQGCIWTVATWVTENPLFKTFWPTLLKKGEPHI